MTLFQSSHLWNNVKILFAHFKSKTLHLKKKVLMRDFLTNAQNSIAGEGAARSFLERNENLNPQE